MAKKTLQPIIENKEDVESSSDVSIETPIVTKVKKERTPAQQEAFQKALQKRKEKIGRASCRERV
jgi:hypothetical protein